MGQIDGWTERRQIIQKQKPLSDFNPLGMWGCALGPYEASALMATSPRKEVREEERMPCIAYQNN